VAGTGSCHLGGLLCVVCRVHSVRAARSRSTSASAPPASSSRTCASATSHARFRLCSSRCRSHTRAVSRSTSAREEKPLMSTVAISASPCATRRSRAGHPLYGRAGLPSRCAGRTVHASAPFGRIPVPPPGPAPEGRCRLASTTQHATQIATQLRSP
jgi:hypothetical protein